MTLLWGTLRGNEAVSILKNISQLNKTRLNIVVLLCSRGGLCLNNCLLVWLGVDRKCFHSEREIFCLPLIAGFSVPVLSAIFLSQSSYYVIKLISEALILLRALFVIPTVCFRPRLLNQLVRHSLIKFQVIGLDHCLSKNKHFDEQKQFSNPAVQGKQVTTCIFAGP